MPRWVRIPGLDEIAAQEVVAHLLGCEELGFEQGCQGLVPLVGAAERAGDLQGVAGSSLGRNGACVEPWADIDGELDVAELHCRGYSVDGDVGWSERGLESVRVVSKATGCDARLLEELSCGGSVVVSSGCHGPGQRVCAVHRQHRGRGLGKVRFVEVDCVAGEPDCFGVVAGREQRVRDRSQQAIRSPLDSRCAAFHTSV